MPAFDQRTIDGSNGAVLYVQETAPRDAELERPDGVIASTKGSRALVVSLSAPRSQGADLVLDASIRVAQEALDVWAVSGVMARTLAPVADEHIVFWTDDEGMPVCRIWGTTRMDPKVEARLEVRDSEGNVVPPTPKAIVDWHPSFRFFRLGQAATDLVDAFRNYYLAFEALLTSIEPMHLRDDGRPAEQEAVWLGRALSKAATIVDFSAYTRPDANGNPVDDIKAEIYTGARTRTFHAKTGAAVLMPHDDETRAALRDLVERLRRLYLDLASAVLGIRFLGGGGLAPAGFRAMVSGASFQEMYVSSQAVDESTSRKGELPATFTVVDAAYAPEFDDEYHVAYRGTLLATGLESNLVVQLGTILNGAVGIYEDLEGELDVSGLHRIECVIAIEAQDPRALGTHYLS